MNNLHHNSWKIERAERIAAVKRNVGENDDLLNLASLAFSPFSDSTRMAFDKRLTYFAGVRRKFRQRTAVDVNPQALL